ncbi:MAG: GyrI-like domain-containing protein [Sediminibacterium sp.]
MNIEIINEKRSFEIYGFEDRAINKNYSETAFGLMNKMWQVVKSNGLPNKGLNIWVYESNEMVFAGVELSETPKQDTGLEFKKIEFTKYACYKHLGSYALIKIAGQQMRDELKSKGFETSLPYMEIYGHHTNDESKAETELIMQLS